MRRLVSLLALMLTVCAVLALADKDKDKNADPNVRSVQGIVMDADGNPVTGAVVHLENKKTQQIRSYITREGGTYSFHGLSTNVDYELKAEYKSDTSAVRALSIFDSRRKAVVDLKLKKK